jgi:hypothetical protein
MFGAVDRQAAPSLPAGTDVVGSAMTFCARSHYDVVMMATTHAFVGVAVASAYAMAGGDYPTAAVVGSLAGGVFPDLDVLAEHRKTLHFPVYYAILSVLCVGAAAVVDGPVVVGVAAFVVAAAIHATSDALGGGLELRPWEGNAEEAVYLHPTGRWVRPRRFVRYDGAPEDFVVGVAFAVPAWVAFDGWVRAVIAVCVGVSFVYAVVRKRLPVVEEWLVD